VTARNPENFAIPCGGRSGVGDARRPAGAIRVRAFRHRQEIIDAGDNFSTRETTLTMVRPLRLHWAGNNHQSAPIVDLNRFTRGRQPNSRKLLNVRNYATANPPNYYPMMIYLLTARATVSQRVDVVEKLFGEPRFVPAG
jgi:hypothetical protein